MTDKKLQHQSCHIPDLFFQIIHSSMESNIPSVCFENIPFCMCTLLFFVNLYVFKVFCNCFPLNFKVCVMTKLLSYFKTSFICYLLSYVHIWFVRDWYVWILNCYVYKHKEIYNHNWGNPCLYALSENLHFRSSGKIMKIDNKKIGIISIVCSSMIKF